MTDNELFHTGGAFDALPDQAAEFVASLKGRVLSGYKVGDVIGYGGMGYVVSASRAENDFERVVAIKVVPGTLGSSEIAARFRTEVQILARLNHPSIAQLYDAGETKEGWPYLVMEYVDGSPIDQYCADNALDVYARVELLVNVARAVRFAHARLIVHRDLKPSNVLVDKAGHVKLLDFGIAKLLEPGTPEHTIGHRPMTPKYASPEQLLGADITTGSDIYQLGVLMLAIVAEETPMQSATLQDAIKNAAAGRDTAIADHVAERIPDDLLAIATHCLHASPDDRYTDVNALIEDLGRYREGFPVQARKGSRTYRLRKLVQRNIPATAFAALALAIAIGGTTSYVINISEARRIAEQRAETSSEVLQAMSRLIADTYSELIETRGARSAGQATDPQLQNEPLRMLLERNERLIDSVVTDHEELRAELLLVQGMTNRELDRLDSARPQLETALALMREAGNRTGELSVLLELTKLAAMTERREEARDYTNATVALLDESSAPALLQGKILTVATVTTGDDGRYEEALQLGKRAVAILQSLESGPTVDLGRAYAELGLVYGRLEKPAQMREQMGYAIDVYTELEGPSYRGLSKVYNGLAFSYAMSGEYEESVNYIEKDLEITRTNFGEQHVRVAIGHTNMAIPLRRMGRYEEAIESLLAAEAVLDASPSASVSRYVQVYINLANVYQDLGRLQEGLEIFERALALPHEEILPRNMASILNNSGDLMMVTGRLDEGIERLLRAEAYKTDLYGKDNVSTARTQLLLAQAYLLAGQLSAVPELLESANATFLATYGADHMKLSFSELVTGQYQLASGDIAAARTTLETAHRHRLEEYEPENIVVLSAVFSLVRTELADGNVSAARGWLDQTKVSVPGLADSHPYAAEAWVLEAEVLTAEGRGSDAMAASARARGRIEQYFAGRADWRQRLDAL